MMKKGRLSPREAGKRLTEKFFAVKKLPILATPYLGMKKGRLSPREVGKRLAEKFFAVKNFQYSPPLIWGMKKGRLSPTFFAPNLTIDLTYLCLMVSSNINQV